MNHVSEALKQTVGRALGRIPSGVYILTTRDAAGRATAMMASWVQQAAFDPPVVSVAIGKGRPAGDAVRATGQFALSVLGEHDSPLMKKYARGVPEGVDPFDGVPTLATPGNAIALAGALAYLECQLLTVCDFGADHDLFLGRVTAGALLREGSSFTHTRGNGFHY